MYFIIVLCLILLKSIHTSDGQYKNRTVIVHMFAKDCDKPIEVIKILTKVKESTEDIFVY